MVIRGRRWSTTQAAFKGIDMRKVTKRTTPYDGIPVVMREYGTPEWQAMGYCDTCNADVSGPIFQQEDDSNRYCENCWDVVQEANRDYAIGEIA